MEFCIKQASTNKMRETLMGIEKEKMKSNGMK
jgi:hypothetical protein